MVTLDIIRALTPFITLTVVLGLGIIGWLIRKLIAENSLHFEDLERELKDKIDERSQHLEKRIDKVEQDLEKLEISRQTDQKHLYQQFVSKESFFLTLNKTEQSVNRIFKHINELSKWVNQAIGAGTLQNKG